MSKPLFEHDRAVADWVSKKLGRIIYPPYSAIGWLDDSGTLYGGAVFTNCNGSNVEVTIYGPGAFTKSALRLGIRYVFEGLKVNRLTATTERRNKTMCKFLARRSVGFVHEAVQPRMFGPYRANDGIVFRMMRDDARKWLS